MSTHHCASKSRAAWATRLSHTSSTDVALTSTSAVSSASRRASRTCSVEGRTSSTSTPSTSPISATSVETRWASGSSTTSSSMTRPAPRSRMSMPTTSPRTAPMRLATAPSAPGRSGNHRRTTKVSMRWRVPTVCEREISCPRRCCEFRPSPRPRADGRRLRGAMRSVRSRGRRPPCASRSGPRSPGRTGPGGRT